MLGTACGKWRITMDYSDGVKYTLFRLLLMIGCGAVGVAAGKLLLWATASVMPASLLTLKEFLVTDQAGSVTAAIVMAAMLGRVFYDDGKKHAAYENWDAILVSITHIVMLIAYFVPVIFYNPNDITRGVEFAYYLFYFPCRWLVLAFGMDLKAAAALGILLILGVQFALYMLSYTRYKKKHPVSFLPRESES